MPQSTTLPPGYKIKSVPFASDKWKFVRIQAEIGGLSIREYFDKLLADAIEKKKRGKR